MKKILLSMMALVLTCASASAQAYKVDASKAIDAEATAFDGMTAVVTDQAGEKTWAAFSGGDGQDINTNCTSVKAWGSASEYSTMKFFAVEGMDADIYYIKFVNANGDFYFPRGNWHDKSGMLNVTGNGNGLFVGGLNGRNGQDAQDAALWKVAKTAEGYTLYNVGKAKYAVPGIGVTSIETAVKLYTAFAEYDPEAEEGDYTGRIVNPAINGSNGWTIERPNGGNGPLLNNVSFEYWAGNANPRDDGAFNYYQTIVGLPAGKYVLSAQMYNSSNGETGEHAPNGNAGLYIATSADEKFVGVTADGTDLVDYSTEEIVVEEGETVVVGVKSIGYMSARWFVADNFTLTRTGDLDGYSYVVNAQLTAKQGSTTLGQKTINGLKVKIDWDMANKTCDITLPEVGPIAGYTMDATTITGVTVSEYSTADRLSYSSTEPIYFNGPEGKVGTTNITASGTYTKKTNAFKVTVTAKFADGKILTVVFTNGNDEILDIPTAIESVETTTAKAAKFMQNGRLVIIKNGKTYNAAGQLMK